MNKPTADQIVANMLEDFAGDEDPETRAGGKKDMWRQGGFKKFSLKGKDFGGKRPNDDTKPVKDEDESDDASAPKEDKPNPRFKLESKAVLKQLGCE